MIVCVVFSILINHRFPQKSCLFFHFFFVRHFGPIDKKESLPTPRTNKVCTPLLSSLLFLLSITNTWEEEDEGRVSRSSLDDCLRVDSFSRAPSSTKEEASSHLSD